MIEWVVRTEDISIRELYELLEGLNRFSIEKVGGEGMQCVCIQKEGGLITDSYRKAGRENDISN